MGFHVDLAGVEVIVLFWVARAWIPAFQILRLQIFNTLFIETS